MVPTNFVVAWLAWLAWTAGILGLGYGWGNREAVLWLGLLCWLGWLESKTWDQSGKTYDIVPPTWPITRPPDFPKPWQTNSLRKKGPHS